MLRTKTLLLFPLLAALACTACGAAAPSGVAGATGSADTTPPSVPGGFTAVAAGSTAANLSWNASTDNVGGTGVADYIVRRNGAQVATPVTLNYMDTGLSPATTYSYTVAARDAAGNTSANSPSRSVTTAVAPPADTIPPSVPANLVATPGANAISLTWNASTDNVAVTGYTVRRNGTPVSTSVATSYIDSGLVASTTYTYTVSAFDAAGNASAQSAAATATTLAAGTQTALGALAAVMQPGQWADFTMGGLNQSLVTAAGGGNPTIISFAARLQWDQTHKKLQFIGQSHVPGVVGVANACALITWDDATNQWVRESYDSNSVLSHHSYYELAIDPTRGDLYNIVDGATIKKKAWGSSSGAASWVGVTNYPNLGSQVAGGLEWFPQLNGGAGGLVFVDVLGPEWSDAGLANWQSANAGSGSYDNFIARAGGNIYFGGGHGNLSMYRFGPTGTVTQMPDTPIGVGVNSVEAAGLIAAPNGTDLLLFEWIVANGRVWKFSGGAWTQLANHQMADPQWWIMGSVPDYGVVVFLAHPAGAGTPYARVYKP